MKKLLYSSLALVLLATAACNKTTETNTETNTEVTASADNTYGEKITPDGAIEVAELNARMANQDSLAVKIKGEIADVCQKKGCWVTINMPNGEPMRVMFGEDDFFVPKDVTGKTAIMEGVAMKEVVSVDMQRHFLEDAGKSKEEIMAITKPDTTLTFEARGIIIL